LHCRMGGQASPCLTKKKIVKWKEMKVYLLLG
jgi:hypothetical protein